MLSVKGNVDMRTGNFYSTFTDVVFDQSPDLKMVRVYNTQSEYSGLFGHGWSSNLETHLQLLANNRILVRDFGGGSMTYFKGSANFPEGTIFETEQYGYEVLTKIKDGFKRLTHEGTFEYFDDQGYLKEIINSSTNSMILISYDVHYKIDRVSDNLQHELLFSYNELGFVETVRGTNVGTATYKYTSVGSIYLLHSSEDISSNRYQYQYDDKGKMTGIRYADEKTMNITYDDKYRVLKEVSKGGSYTEYIYNEDKRDPEFHFLREARTYDSNGRMIKKINKEFRFKLDENNHLLLTYYKKNDKSDSGNLKSSMKMKFKGTGMPYDSYSSIFDD